MFAGVKPDGAGRAGLMDMLAGGHVDDATFAQAVELLKLEDWGSLRLLLAGIESQSSGTVITHSSSS